jgi:hypothetical protein
MKKRLERVKLEKQKQKKDIPASKDLLHWHKVTNALWLLNLYSNH